MAGTAQLARQGITGDTFGAGTVFSVHLNPLRDGSNFGARVGAIAKCPVDAGHQQAEAARAGQALRFGAGPHADRRHDVLDREPAPWLAWLSVLAAVVRA